MATLEDVVLGQYVASTSPDATGEALEGFGKGERYLFLYDFKELTTTNQFPGTWTTKQSPRDPKQPLLHRQSFMSKMLGGTVFLLFWLAERLWMRLHFISIVLFYFF